MTKSASSLTASAATLETLNQAAGSFGTAIVDAFAKGTAQGQSFDQVLQSVGKNIKKSMSRDFQPLFLLNRGYLQYAEHQRIIMFCFVI